MKHPVDLWGCGQNCKTRIAHRDLGLPSEEQNSPSLCLLVCQGQSLSLSLEQLVCLQPSLQDSSVIRVFHHHAVDVHDANDLPLVPLDDTGMNATLAAISLVLFLGTCSIYFFCICLPVAVHFSLSPAPSCFRKVFIVSLVPD